MGLFNLVEKDDGVGLPADSLRQLARLVIARPEFINRVDAVITFNRLSEKDFQSIARIMLDELRDSLKEKGITFTYDATLVDFLTKKSYSRTYGAFTFRPWASVISPSSRICRRTFSTSGWAA